MPSSSTSARDAPLAPTPRSETPCDVGLALRLPERRKSVNPGTCRNASSVVDAAVVCIASRVITTTLAGVSLSRVFVCVAVTTIVSDEAGGDVWGSSTRTPQTARRANIGSELRYRMTSKKLAFLTAFLLTLTLAAAGPNHG